MNTNGLNYCTNYSYRFNSDEIENCNASCFNDLYRRSKNLSKISGFIATKVFFDKKLNENCKNNYCLLNDSEVKKYLEWIEFVTEFKVEESNEFPVIDKISSAKFKIFTTKFEDKFSYEVRLIPALIRNMYEFPFNEIVKTAFLMETYAEFIDLDFTERLCVSINSTRRNDCGHSIFNGNSVFLYSNESIRFRYLDNKSKLVNVNGFLELDIELELAKVDYFDGECNLIEESQELSKGFREVLISNYKSMKKYE